MQKVLKGICSLPSILRDVGCERLFLVIDSSYPFLSIKESIETLSVKEKVYFSKFTPNPTYEQVSEGVELLRASCCDTILAIGGGSAIDVAKCIKLVVLAKEGHNAIIPPLVSCQVQIDSKRFPFIAIPTTAGTGSESTHNAVMYYKGAKQTVVNDGVLPDFAILEPTVLDSLPLYQKKCTMLDALCQGIESWWSINSTEESKVFSKKCVDLIVANWKEYIFDNDKNAAAQVLVAANFGGRAINIAQTTAAHAMSYKITSLYGLPHGHAVAICLPTIWDFMLLHMDQIIDPRGIEYLRGVFSGISCSLGTHSVESAIRFLRQMISDLGLDTPAPDKLFSNLDLLVDSVNPVRLKNNPIELTSSNIRNLYLNIAM